MSREYIEITEKTVDDAITAACTKLGVTSARLDYEVIQKEKTGFLGIGAKPAIIKARIKEAEKAPVEVSAPKKEKASRPKPAPADVKKKTENDKTQSLLDEVLENTQEPKKEEVKSEAEPVKEEAAEGKKEPRRNRNRRGRRSHGAKKSFAEAPAEAAEAAPVRERTEPKKKAAAVPVLTDEQITEIRKKADVFLKDVFKAMNMEVEISERYDKETGILTVDIEGDDMGVLIGKRGQTLDSLQYLVSLVVNKGIDGYIHVKADTENYRERRKKTLENLAKNIAFKVKKTRKSVALEPMNPYERRIIHSALQGDKFVTTYSEGEEPNRKVIVALKK